MKFVREYLKEMRVSNGERDVSSGTVGLEVWRERRLCRAEEDITKEEEKREIKLKEWESWVYRWSGEREYDE